MIELKLAYDDSSIKTAFGSRRFLLEAVAGRNLERDKDLNLLFREVQRMSLASRSTMFLSILRSYVPIELVRFNGLSMGSASWWGAIVHLKAAGKTSLGSNLYLCLLGWSNRHGTTACVVSSDESREAALESLEMRTNTKLDNKYDVDFVSEGLVLASGSAVLPRIAGLPVVDAFSADNVSSLPPPLTGTSRALPAVEKEEEDVEDNPFGFVEVKIPHDPDLEPANDSVTTAGEEKSSPNSLKEVLSAKRKNVRW